MRCKLRRALLLGSFHTNMIRIMFIREFNEIASAISVEQLQRRLKPEEFEKFGDPFIPEFVYDAIRRLPRFASMRVRPPVTTEESFD